MARRNGANGGNGETKPPAWVHAWWSTAKQELKTELKAEFEPRFQKIEAMLTLIQMQLEAHDKRISRLEGRFDGLDRRITRLEGRT